MMTTLRKLVGRFLEKPGEEFQPVEEKVDPFLTQQAISRAICTKQPFLASRLGFTESFCLTQSASGNANQDLFDRIWRFSGVFPATADQFRAFEAAYLGALMKVDVLGTMKDRYAAFLVNHSRTDALTCRLSSLEPYLFPFPWSEHLAGLRVCVIHPFSESIRRQYSERRNDLFFDKRVLPEFHLRTVKAPQTLAGNTDGHKSWSDALRWLEDQVFSQDFDVAISGCGAYGLPLGGTIKDRGKICVHLGGAAQVLFGISGSKWRKIPAFRVIMNPSWRPPLDSEKPAGAEKVEDACYW
ncbi:MAG: hypothetical protein Fur0032_01810 [Terrimicrobiaceae bacterium]